MLEIKLQEKWGLDVIFAYDETDKAEDISTVLAKAFSAFISAEINSI